MQATKRAEDSAESKARFGMARADIASTRRKMCFSVSVHGKHCRPSHLGGRPWCGDLQADLTRDHRAIAEEDPIGPWSACLRRTRTNLLASNEQSTDRRTS